MANSQEAGQISSEGTHTAGTRWPVKAVMVIAVLVVCVGCGAAPMQGHESAAVAERSPVRATALVGDTMKISSSAFGEGEMIPKQYTCDGANFSPPLSWTDVPQGTKTLALVVEDPDAGAFVHWAVFNLPPDVTELPEGFRAEKSLQNGAVNGTNSFRKMGYSGPCPPSGKHRYYFKLYALDGPLALNNSATGRDLANAMKGRILGQAQFMGRYKR